MRKYIASIILIGTLFLSACNFGSSTEKDLADVLSKLNSAEEKYREAQGELSSLEKSEQTLFNEIIQLTQEEKEELKTKVSEVEESLEKRLTFLNDEETSIKKAKESVASFDEIIEKADEEKMKAEITELRDSVNNRYDLHSDFVKKYKSLADLQKELYGMLVDEETEVSNLQEKVKEVNKQNETVKEIISSFNEATGTVNKLKEDLFSKLAEK